jgi:uncharacterized protein
MVIRDEVGYIVRIGAHTPPRYPWFNISARLAHALIGYEVEHKIVSQVGIYSARYDMGSLENPKSVARGDFDVAFTNPPLNARFAMEGIGPYDKPQATFRAIARFPEPDYMVWMVAEELDVTSLGQIAERKIPLRVVSGRMGPEGPDPLSFLNEEVMRAYGFGQRQLESWGGKVIHAGNTIAGAPYVIDRRADAIFQEAAFGYDFDEILKARRVRVLPLDERVIRQMEEKWGFERAAVPAGRFEGVPELPTLAYAGWLLFCRDDFPDELAYELARTCDEQREWIGAMVKDQPPLHRGLEYPITREHLVSKCVIPMHPGAERYWCKVGAL